MLQHARHLTPDRRTDARAAVNLPCQLTFTDRTTTAQVVDISTGGVGVDLPLHCSAYDFNDLTTIHIRSIGMARVTWRWSRDKRIGLEFITPELVRQPIQHLLTSKHWRDGLRPIGG